MINRRHVLALLAAAPFGAGACSPSNLPDPIAAWRDPGAGEADPRRFALAHAILAPNPHNRQPWLIELIGEDEFIFNVDLDRLLPATDPFDRQITLGCGAFLELFDLAARANGHVAEINLWPEGEPQPRLDSKPIAHVKLLAQETPKDPLFDQILARRTNREAFEAREVPEDQLVSAANDAIWPWRPPNVGGTADASPAPTPLRIEWSRTGEQLAALRALAWNGFDRECHTPSAYQESVDLMRIGRAEIAAHRDGLVLDGPTIEFARMVGLLNRATLADVENTFTKQGIEAWRPLAENAPAYAWMTSLENTRTAQIIAGRAYARFNLAATARGLAMHPWSQTLQEYPEMAELYAEAERITAAREGQTVQMLVRIGYSETVSPAPRRGLAEHLHA
jgi:hypothetical protein